MQITTMSVMKNTLLGFMANQTLEEKRLEKLKTQKYPLYKMKHREKGVKKMKRNISELQGNIKQQSKYETGSLEGAEEEEKKHLSKFSDLMKITNTEIQDVQ